MRKIIKLLFIIHYSFFIFSAANAESFLTAETFPQTFSDLSFTQRMAVLADGYAPWESEYDPVTRKCIKNCAYPGMTIESELSMLERNTAAANARAEVYRATHPDVFQMQRQPPQIQQVVVESNLNQTNIRPQVATPTNVAVIGGAPESGRGGCSPRKGSVPPAQSIPLGNPLDGSPRVSSGYGYRIHPVTKQPSVHKGIDLSATTGTQIYSPAAGVVESVWTDATCGNGLRVRHSDGFASLYCHLSEYSVKKGETVGAGCPIAKVGNTGRSTGPHLHYGIYFDNNLIDPTGYLNAR